jgi:hypothetical protein
VLFLPFDDFDQDVFADLVGGVEAVDAGPAVGGDAQRPQPLGNLVGPFARVFDHFFEFDVQRVELRAGHVPVCLLALQAKINQVHQHCLELGGRFLCGIL